MRITISTTVRITHWIQQRFLLFFILCFIIFFSTSCSLIKPVAVTGVRNFQTVNTDYRPELRFDVALANPNNFGVKIKKMEIGIASGDSTLARVSLLEATKITRRESMLVAVALTPAQDEISKLFRTAIEGFLFGKEEQQFQIKGEIVIKKFIFTRKYQIKERIRL